MAVFPAKIFCLTRRFCARLLLSRRTVASFSRPTTAFFWLDLNTPRPTVRDATPRSALAQSETCWTRRGRSPVFFWCRRVGAEICRRAVAPSTPVRCSATHQDGARHARPRSAAPIRCTVPHAARPAHATPRSTPRPGRVRAARGPGRGGPVCGEAYVPRRVPPDTAPRLATVRPNTGPWTDTDCHNVTSLSDTNCHVPHLALPSEHGRYNGISHLRKRSGSGPTGTDSALESTE